ncbi:MAG: hypothetical protein JXQ71_06275 [Verrucomicrobia bacterium]|nr:hypothetical protein [Verrucomicrobiota bacterium]
MNAMHSLLAGVVLGCGVAGMRGSAAEAPQGVRLFYRILGARSNGPLLPKTRTLCGADGAATTGQTGMADSGFTEYPHCVGRTSYTFAEQYAFFPRWAAGVPIDPSGVNVGDILVDHVYEPVAIVWGLRGREFVQTFVAAGRELVSVTLLVPSERGLFRAALIEGGPGGRQVGAAKAFSSGHSMEWGHVTWLPGEAPLQAGRTYGLRLWRQDGQCWSPFLHATGDCYDDGLLYVDQMPRPESDLGAWIIEEPADVSRALIENADPLGTVRHDAGFVFVPRTPNVRLITVTASPVPMACGDMVLSVWTTEEPPRRLAGPKRCLSCGPTHGPHTAHFLFAPDELPVVPGQRYRAGLAGWVNPKMPMPAALAGMPPAVLDSTPLVYGEPIPEGLAAIHNLKAAFPVTNRIMELTWKVSRPCPVRVEIKRLRSPDVEIFNLEPGIERLTIPKLWPGHEYDFRLSAAGRGGLVWRTPLYRLQIPQGPHPIIPPFYREHPACFVPIAPPPPLKSPDYGPLRYSEEVPVTNGDFEEGLAGWSVSRSNVIYAATAEHGISPRFGKRMAGWSHGPAKRREQVFEESWLTQSVPTRPGHTYVLSARIHTSVANGPRGDARVRLAADPRGATDLTGPNASQWYWTESSWPRFQHRFTAQGKHATIGLGFFRWRNGERASAYVDHVRVFDLGASPAALNDPAPYPDAAPTRVLTDRRVDVENRVEAELTAPPGYVITGLGARAHEDNLTTLWLQIRPLQADGTLGAPEELRGGWEPDANLEAKITLPDGYVATGFGGRIAPEWDVKTLALWGRPLRDDGVLGEPRAFRAGIESEGGLEKQIQLPAGRVLGTVGLNCGFNDLNRIKCASFVLGTTATARAGGVP